MKMGASFPVDSLEGGLMMWRFLMEDMLRAAPPANYTKFTIRLSTNLVEWEAE
jgi:hypothetical protein